MLYLPLLTRYYGTLFALLTRYYSTLLAFIGKILRYFICLYWKRPLSTCLTLLDKVNYGTLFALLTLLTLLTLRGHVNGRDRVLEEVHVYYSFL